jgi:hypothetical protein
MNHSRRTATMAEASCGVWTRLLPFYRWVTTVSLDKLDFLAAQSAPRSTRE